MAVRAPSIIWPTGFDEVGPDQDPSILLSASAEVGGVPYVVTALRMQDGLRFPDYKSDVPRAAYDDKLDSLQDEIEALASSIDPDLIELETGRYLLWMVPKSGER